MALCDRRRVISSTRRGIRRGTAGSVFFKCVLRTEVGGIFGYVRPLKGSLRVAEYERFRAIYCGLCRTLSKRYGLKASLLLNFDLAFFAAAAEGLASSEPGAPRTMYITRRCIAHPFRKRCMACAEGGEPSEALALAADLTVLLACFKLRDDLADAGFFKRLGSRLALVALSRAEKKAKRFRPELYGEIERQLGSLAALESEHCDSMDMCADCFAGILRAAGNCVGCGACREDGFSPAGNTFGELLYHVGRWIYIIDAYDDLDRDAETGAYNAVAARYGVSSSADADGGGVRQELERTLSMSLDAAYAAYERLDFGTQSGFVSNVLLSGLDTVSRSVFDRTWRQGNDKRRITDERPL